MTQRKSSREAESNIIRGSTAEAGLFDPRGVRMSSTTQTTGMRAPWERINNHTQLHDIKEMALYPALDFYYLAMVLTRVRDLQ